jgi:hypothetical protein
MRYNLKLNESPHPSKVTIMILRLPILFFAVSFSVSVAGLVTGVVVAEDKAASKIDLARGKFMMVAPSTWESVPPKSGIVEYEFKAPKDKKEDTARITIMQATGGVAANVDRWKGQFEGVKEGDVKEEKKDISGATVYIVDIAGTFKESMGGGPFAPGKIEKRENYRMLGAIIETKDSGTIFVKMTGPQATVESLVEDFKKSVLEVKGK